MKYIKISLVVLLLLLVSCKGEGIFYTLRDEIPIANSRFSDNATITSIFTITDLSSEIHTIASGAVLWERTESSTWRILPYPVNLNKSTTYVTSCVSYQGNIYTVFRDSGRSYIYYYNLNDSTWTNALASLLPDENDNYYLFSDPENDAWLYVNQRAYGGESKYLYFFNTASLDFSVPAAQVSLDGSTDVTIPVISVDFDGSNYFLISNYTLQNRISSIYVASSGSANTFLNNDANVAADQFQEVETISTTAGNLLLVGKKMGTGLEYRTPAGDWKDLGVGNIDGDFALFCFTDLNPQNDIGLQDLIIVGLYNLSNMNDQGYILIDYSDPENLSIASTNIADSNNYGSSELPNSAVNGIAHMYLNPADHSQGYKLYGASNNGMWSFNSVSGLWTQE